MNQIIKLGEWHAKLITNKELNLVQQLERKITLESLEFVEKNMPNVELFKDVDTLFDFSLDSVTVTGLYLEFGVDTGRSINYIANQNKDKKIHGFDSFEGLPEFFYGKNKKNRFNRNGKAPKVKDNVILHRGWFEDSLPEFVKNHNEKIAFLNIDCNLYSSTKTVFDYVGPMIQKDTIIRFDELLNHPFWQNHEVKAFNEFVQQHKIEFTYLGVNGIGSVVLRIDKV